MLDNTQNTANAEAIFAAMRQINGVDDRLLKRPEIAHLPAVLGKGEFPGGVVRDVGARTLFATNRRVVVIQKSRFGSSIEEVDSYEYSEIQSIVEEKGGLFENPLAFRNPLILTISDSGEKFRLESDEDRRTTFCKYVRARIPSAHVYEAMQNLDGVNERLLRRSEVAYLPSVLEEKELPGIVAPTRPNGLIFATEKRMIHIQASLRKTSIRSIDSYPYTEIQSIRTGNGITEDPLAIMVAGKNIRLQARDERRFVLAQFVNDKLTANPLIEPLKKLKGVDDELLQRPEVAHLPSVLEEGEIPGCIATFATLSMAVATDRRVLTIEMAKSSPSIKKIESYPYDEIRSIRAAPGGSTFSGSTFVPGAGAAPIMRWHEPGLSMVVSRKTVHIEADEESRFAFADFVTAKLNST